VNEESPDAFYLARDFFFWGGFEVGIPSTGSLPDLHLHFALECDGQTEEGSRVTRSG
jgi:hypothetical protein